jgi:hypothetical protein
MASILLSVLAVLWLVVVLISLLLTILIPSKRLSKAAQTYLNRRGSGSSRALYND